MSDSTTTESTDTVEPAGQAEVGSSDGGEKTPEFYEKELTRARKDAAKYRDQARATAEETETKLRAEFAEHESSLKARIEELTDKYESAQSTASESERTVRKLRLALDHGIPAEKIDTFTKRLVGETEDELAADAKSLAELFAPAAPLVQEDRSQGSGAAPLNSHTLVTALESVAKRRH